MEREVASCGEGRKDAARNGKEEEEEGGRKETDGGSQLPCEWERCGGGRSREVKEGREGLNRGNSTHFMLKPWL